MRDSEDRTVIAWAECRAKHENKDEIEARRTIFAKMTIKDLLWGLKDLYREY